MDLKCSKCNELFEAQGAWQKLCKRCFARSKEQEDISKQKTPKGEYTYTPETTDRIVRAKGFELANFMYGSGTKPSLQVRLEAAELITAWLRTGQKPVFEELVK
jgi:hypothetical protein